MLSSIAGRLLGPAGKARVGVAAEHVWSFGFSGLQMFVRARPLEWRADRHRRVLVVAPHPDDESIGCAGAILLHKEAGARVIVVCVTDGRTSRAQGLGPDEMAQRRRQEAYACAALLGIESLEWLGFAGGAWGDDQLLTAIDVIARHHDPDVVYAPSCIDFHPEHRQVARVLGRFWTESRHTRAVVRIYPLQVPLTPVVANLVVDVTSTIPQARAAMDAYRTQASNIPRAFRQRRYAARCYGVGVYAEEFWELSAAAYARIHQESVLREATGFRGVREHPVTDPLAYISGRRARRRLAQVAADDARLRHTTA